MSLSFIEEVMLCSMFLKFFLILRPVTCTGTQLACGQEPLTSTLILCAYTPLYSDPSWRKAPYGPTEPATNRLLSPGGKIPTRRQSVRKNSAHVEFFSRKGCRLLPGRKVSTVSLARWTPDISSSLASSQLTPRWLMNPWTLAWYVAVVMTSAPLRRNLLVFGSFH